MTLSAVGIAVKDIERSADFYKRVCGMSEIRRIDLPHIEEIIVGYDGGATGSTSLILMRWKNRELSVPESDQFKLVLRVPDALAFRDLVAKEGLEITRQPSKSSLSNSIMGFAKDPDGHVFEFLEVRK